MLDVMKTMNTHEEKVYDTLGISKEEFHELRDKMIEEWKGKKHIKYFEHIGVNPKGVQEELTQIGVDGGTDIKPTTYVGRLLLDNGIKKIELKHYLFFTEIFKYLANKSIKKGGEAKASIELLEKKGLFSKLISKLEDKFRSGGDRYGK